MKLTGRQLIEGGWVAGGGGFLARNPATGAALEPSFGEASEGQVDAALGAAARAFVAVRKRKFGWQAELLEGMAREILGLGEELIERAHLETALPKARLLSERGRTVGQLQLFASVIRDGAWLDATIDTGDPARQPLPKPDVRRMMVTRGPVVVFGASNFPLAFSVAGGDTASALAGGNPVVVKGHPSHPGTSELVAGAVLRAIESLGLPAEIFALLQGQSHDLSGWLVRHPSTAAVGFTGSQKAGRALFDVAAARPRPIPVFAEMGSLNPLVILPGAVAERGGTLVKELAGSILLGCGQFCTKPGLILTVGDTGDFVKELAAQLTPAPPPPAGVSAGTMLNQPLRDNFVRRTGAWEKIHGVRAWATSGAKEYAGVTAGLFETSAETFLAQAELREEAFGPAALVVRCGGIEEMGRVLEAIGGSLTGTVHAGKGDDAGTAIEALAPFVGRVIVNGYPTGVEVCHAMVHGGPYPATTDGGSTSVGTAAIRRFLRMVAYQNVPDGLLPGALQNANPLGIVRLVNGKMTRDGIT